MNKRKIYHKKWRNANRDHLNAFSRDYVIANTEQRATTTRRYRESIKSDRTHFIKQLLRTAKQNAEKRGTEFTLNFQLIDAWICVQDERCSLTGIRFDYTPNDAFRSRPYAPSIDRRNNVLGYTPENIQIVCCIVNRAKNEFTQEMFDEMCLARVRMINAKI